MEGTQNHYSTLGVSKDASHDEIKKAYRKLSLKYHPDRNQGNAESVQRFQEIGAAYEVLGDVDKRKGYDFTQRMGGGFPGLNVPADGSGAFPGMGPEEVFAQMFGGMGGMPFNPFGGADIPMQPGMSFKVYHNGAPTG